MSFYNNEGNKSSKHWALLLMLFNPHNNPTSITEFGHLFLFEVSLDSPKILNSDNTFTTWVLCIVLSIAVYENTYFNCSASHWIIRSLETKAIQRKFPIS